MKDFESQECLTHFSKRRTIQNSFQTFSKTPKYKTIGCFDKTTSCFSLSLKNTFQLKGLRVFILWIQSRVDLHINCTLDPI